MSFIRSLFAPSLLRALVGRTVIVSVAALVILAAVALYESNDLVSKQFEDEASIVASTAAKQIVDQADLMTRAASLIAGLPTTRELTEDRDADGLRAFLIPQKSRLSVDIMNVASIVDGVYISGAQDFEPGAKLKPELLGLATAGAQTSWVLYDETEGLVIRAIYQIRGRDQEPVGVVEIGSILGNDYVTSINTKSDAQILLVWNGQVRASTFVGADGKALAIDAALFPTVQAVDGATGDTLFRNVTVQGKDYFGIYQVVRNQSQRQNPGVLAVLVPTDAVATAQRTLLAIMGALAAGLIALVTFFAYRSAAAMTSPLSDLAGAAQRIEAGDLGVSVRQRSQHEIGTLERAFDTMARSLYDRVRVRLPGHGSPGWRDVASSLLRGGWL